MTLEEKWNEMSEEFILNACKSFWIDTVTEKVVAILSKFTVTILILKLIF